MYFKCLFKQDPLNFCLGIFLCYFIIILLSTRQKIIPSKLFVLFFLLRLRKDRIRTVISSCVVSRKQSRKCFWYENSIFCRIISIAVSDFLFCSILDSSSFLLKPLCISQILFAADYWLFFLQFSVFVLFCYCSWCSFCGFYSQRELQKYYYTYRPVHSFVTEIDARCHARRYYLLLRMIICNKNAEKGRMSRARISRRS